MTAAHPPGSWINLDDGFGTARKIYRDASGPAIATVHSYSAGRGPVDRERDAYARLIAAAPDLLALAYRIKEHAEHQLLHASSENEADAATFLLHDAHIAIAKATTP